MRGRGDPKDTDPIGGRGRGRGGRKNYIDEIISKSESTAQRPNLGNQNPNLHFKQNLKRGKRFGVLR